MKLTGRRESSNVDDRRSRGTATKAGLGLGGMLLIAVMAYFTSGGDMGQVINAVVENAATETVTSGGEAYTPTKEEEELATFAKQILAGTEDVWTDQFKKMGRTYHAPRLVLFHGSVSSGCGNASTSSGPFYCSADQSVYIDLEFFTTMRQQFGTAGDFAYAYVIAHEVGHHVQNELGILSKVHQMMSRSSEKEANQWSVRLELQADFFAGCWAFHDNKMFNSLEAGDVEEGLAIAAKIGDDYLQKQAYGYTIPESFNHGTSAQRSRWLRKGISRGDLNEMDTYNIPYNDL